MAQSPSPTAFDRRAFWRTAATLALPIALQTFLTNSFSMVDTIMVSQLGDVALSASGMAGQWTTLLMLMVFGLCSGLSVFLSQYWGANNLWDIRRMSGLAILIAQVPAILFMVLGLAVPEFVIGLFNGDPAVVAAGAVYLRTVALSYPGLALFNVFCTMLRSTEAVNLPLAVSGVATLANVFFNYGFIFGKFGLPEMGIKGAALATVITTWLGPVLLVLLAFLRRNFLTRDKSEYLRFTRAHAVVFFRRAIPVMLNETLWGSGVFLFGIIISNLGKEYAAAVTIYKSVDSVMYSLLIGMCTASCIMVGKSIGGGQTELGLRQSRRFVIFMPCAGALIGGFVILARSVIISLFNLTGNLSPLTVSTAFTILMLYGFEIPVRVNAYLFIVGILRPGGDTKSAAFFDLAGQWLVSLPLTYLVAYVLKAPFPIVFATMLYSEDAVKVPLLYWYYFRDKWIRPVTPEGLEGARRFFADRGRPVPWAKRSRNHSSEDT